MARNVEIKARVENPSALFDRAAAISDSGPVEILQEDTFFHCPNGRLKLREFSSSQGQLIFYQRDDSPDPKESRYFISNTSEPATLREVLTLAFDICGSVRKRRLLFLVGDTRIHLDEVEGLGHFVELEVVLTDGESVEAGQTIARDLMAKLAIAEDNLIAGAYVDMLSPPYDPRQPQNSYGKH